MKQLLILIGRLLKMNFSLGLPFPFKMNFSITNRCKYSCKTCNIWKTEKEEMSLDEIENAFEDSGFLSWVSITGGEPFLREDLLELISILDRNNPLFIVNIPTSGFDPTKIKNNVKNILELGLDNLIISVSLDGPEKIHNEIRRDGDSFKNSRRTFETLKKLSKSYKSLKVFYEYLISPYNIDVPVSKVVSEMNIEPSDLHFSIFHQSKHYYSNTDLEKPDNFRLKVSRRIRKILKHRRIYFKPQNFLVNLYLRNFNKEKDFCGALSSSFFLDCNGDVYPCIHFNKKLGNVKNKPLKSILNSKKSKELRSKTKKRDCPGCWSPCSAYQTILSKFLSFL